MYPSILTYHLSPEALSALTEIAGADFILRHVDDTEIHLALAELLGQTVEHPVIQEGLPEPEGDFLLFAYTERDALYRVLAEMKEKGFTFPHKAVLTETTARWRFCDLMGHIAEEHKMVQAYKRLGALVKSAQAYLAENEDETLEELILEAKDLPNRYGEDLTDTIVLAHMEKIASRLP